MGFEQFPQSVERDPASLLGAEATKSVETLNSLSPDDRESYFALVRELNKYIGPDA